MKRRPAPCPARPPRRPRSGDRGPAPDRRRRGRADPAPRRCGSGDLRVRGGRSILGAGAEGLVGHPLRDALHPEDAGALADAAGAGRSDTALVRMRGDTGWVATVLVVRAIAGTADRVVTVRAASEPEQTYANLRTSRDHYRAPRRHAAAARLDGAGRHGRDDLRQPGLRGLLRPDPHHPRGPHGPVPPRGRRPDRRGLRQGPRAGPVERDPGPGRRPGRPLPLAPVRGPAPAHGQRPDRLARLRPRHRRDRQRPGSAGREGRAPAPGPGGGGRGPVRPRPREPRPDPVARQRAPPRLLGGPSGGGERRRGDAAGRPRGSRRDPAGGAGGRGRAQDLRRRVPGAGRGRRLPLDPGDRAPPSRPRRRRGADRRPDPRHHGPEGRRARADRRQGGGRGGPRRGRARRRGQDRVPLGDEPRDPHAAQRGDRLRRAAGRIRPARRRSPALRGTRRDRGANLRTVVDDILDFSSVEAGAINLDPEPVALRPSSMPAWASSRRRPAPRASIWSPRSTPRCPTGWCATPGGCGRSC